MKRFLQDLEVIKIAFELVTLYSDSMAALVSAKDPKYHGKTKHIKIRYHFVKEMITKNELVMKHIPTNQMVADPFTKPITKDAFARHVRSLGFM